MKAEFPIEGVKARAFTVPTDKPEADGTIKWNSTTLVISEVSAGGVTGLGYTYSAASVAGLIREKLAKTIGGLEALDPQRIAHVFGVEADMIRIDDVPVPLVCKPL